MTDKRPLPDDILALSLSAAHKVVHQSAARQARKFGLQIEAWQVMEALETGERLTMGRLAEMAMMKAPALSKLVDRMVSDGLVHRQLAQADQRQVNVLLTDLGRKRMMQVREAMLQHDRDLRAQLGEDQARQIQQILRQIRALEQ